MDIGLAAGMTARLRDEDDRRYGGCVMWSAMPWAPVVDDRGRIARLWRSLRRKGWSTPLWSIRAR